MTFAEFITTVGATIRTNAEIEHVPAGSTLATWSARTRRANVALLEPRNVSVTLSGEDGKPDTTWYPIDAALVPVVSNRITGYLSEA